MHLSLHHHPSYSLVAAEGELSAEAVHNLLDLLALVEMGASGIDSRLLRANRATTIVIRGHELDIAVWHVGDALVVAAPVELFGELAVDLRRRLERPVLLATLTNGWNGYWPHRGAFAEGGYEVGAAPAGLEPGDGEALIDHLVELARQDDR